MYVAISFSFMRFFLFHSLCLSFSVSNFFVSLLSISWFYIFMCLSMSVFYSLFVSNWVALFNFPFLLLLRLLLLLLFLSVFPPSFSLSLHPPSLSLSLSLSLLKPNAASCLQGSNCWNGKFLRTRYKNCWNAFFSYTCVVNCIKSFYEVVEITEIFILK